MKTCSRCRETKPRDAFYRWRARQDGLRASCKECDSAWKREYRQRPEVRELERERQREYMREYCQQPEVRERHRECERKRYHQPAVKEQRREYRQRPEVKERQREYMREYMREYTPAYNARPGVKDRKNQQKRERSRQIRKAALLADVASLTEIINGTGSDQSEPAT